MHGTPYRKSAGMPPARVDVTRLASRPKGRAWRLPPGSKRNQGAQHCHASGRPGNGLLTRALRRPPGGPAGAHGTGGYRCHGPTRGTCIWPPPRRCMARPSGMPRESTVGDEHMGGEHGTPCRNSTGMQWEGSPPNGTPLKRTLPTMVQQTWVRIFSTCWSSGGQIALQSSTNYKSSCDAASRSTL